jgi:hypothetical protein
VAWAGRARELDDIVLLFLISCHLTARDDSAGPARPRHPGQSAAAESAHLKLFEPRLNPAPPTARLLLSLLPLGPIALLLPPSRSGRLPLFHDAVAVDLQSECAPCAPEPVRPPRHGLGRYPGSAVRCVRVCRREGCQQGSPKPYRLPGPRREGRPPLPAAPWLHRGPRQFRFQGQSSPNWTD